MRLIDADALKDLFCSRCSGYGDCANEGFTRFCSAKSAIDISPTIDAVPVVRCKDCINSKPNDGKLCEGARYCTMHTDGYTLDAVWDCDFCSYGEHRKSDK